MRKQVLLPFSALKKTSSGKSRCSKLNLKFMSLTTTQFSLSIRYSLGRCRLTYFTNGIDTWNSNITSIHVFCLIPQPLKREENGGEKTIYLDSMKEKGERERA